MKERPTLFSAPMVRALLAGTKTQTRRTMKKQPDCGSHKPWPDSPVFEPSFDDDGSVHCASCGSGIHLTRNGVSGIMCPYGKPGDLLWVRETWTGTWNGPEAAFGMHLVYAADGSERIVAAPGDYVLPKAAAKAGNFVTPLFMPRWASRITLRITDVRVERLQDISGEDVSAEGIQARGEAMWGKRWWVGAPDVAIADARKQYADLWESINGAGSWDLNPWVWAISFERQMPEVR